MKYKHLLCAVLVSGPLTITAQNSVGIGTENSNNHAVLELVSPTNNQGFLVPRLTTSQRTSTGFTGVLSADENGLLVYDSNENKFYYWHDGQWQSIKNGPELAAGSGISITGGVITNTGDADTDPSNEIQDLSLSGTTLTITNNASATPIDLSPFSGANTDQQTLSFNNGTQLLSILNGNSVNLSSLINDADASATNELQTLSLSGNTLSLSSGGGSIPLFSGSFNDLTGIPADLDTDASDDFDGDYNSLSNLPALFSGAFADLTGLPPGLADGDDVDDADNSPTNELQNLSATVAGTNRTINITGGSGATISVADNDNSTTNELQNLSRSGNTLALSSGGSVDIIEPIGFRAGSSEDQNLPFGTTTNINFKNVAYDLKGNYDGNSLFVAPVTGVYNFSGLLTLQMDGGGASEIYLMVENKPVHTLSTHTLNENGVGSSFTTDYRLNAGERVFIAVHTLTTPAILIGDDSRSNWSARLILNLE